MKNPFKRLWKKMNSPKTERTLIVLLPCVSVFIVAVILAPRLLYYIDRALVPESEVIIEEAVSQRSASSTSAPAAAVSPSPSPSAAVSSVKPAAATAPVASTPAATTYAAATASAAPTAAPVAARTKVYMSGSSTEKDLYIKLTDGSGNMLTGQRFTLSFSYPSGEQYSFKTETDGSCYLVKLEPGDYTVTMSDHEGYVTAEPISCTVKAAVEYVQIEDIAEIVKVVDNTEISQSELKTGSDSLEEIKPEVISTPEEVSGGDSVILESNPVLDASGNQTYTYSFNVGANGFLLLNDGITESDVVPMDENNDGTPEYGLKWVNASGAQSTAGNASGQSGYYTTVELYNADNTPVSAYSVTAVPITETVETMIGWQTIDGNTYYYSSDGSKVTGLKNIDGKVYYFNQYGVRAKSLGVDVSFYNEGINWPAVKAQGIDFAIVRAGGRGWETGLLYDDACFQQNINGARAAGLQLGVYFYSTAMDAVEAVQEASLVLERLAGASLEYPIFIDVEQSGDYPNGRSDQLTKAQRTEIINAFCATVENSGYKSGVYSGQNFFKNSLELSFLTRYTIWLASYTSFNRVPNFSGNYDIWQFTDSGIVNGISGIVDMNAIF